MDVQTIQAIGMLVNSIGLPATVGLVAILTAWYLLPVLAEYLRAKVELNKATAAKVWVQQSATIKQLPLTNQSEPGDMPTLTTPGPHGLT